MNLGNILRIIGQFAPQVLMFTPLAPIAGIVAGAMQEAQGMVGATGAQKLQHVTAIAIEAAQAANVEAGRQVIDPAVVADAAASAIATTKSVVNMVHAAHVETLAAA